MTRRELLAALLAAAAAGCGDRPSSPSGTNTGGPPTMTFTAESSTFEAATAEYRRLWADEGSRIVGAMQGATGLTFIQSTIPVIVYEGISLSGNRDTPMRLRASYVYEDKQGAIVHELGHRLISQLTTRPDDLDEHRVLDLFLYDVWVTLWGQAFADRQVQVESGRRGVYDYESAWRWALSLSAAERASRFEAIVRANRR
jgi:hypothetical protein